VAQILGVETDLFRRQAGELTASFARLFGAHHLDLAERVVQETLLGAFRRWPHDGVPDDPRRWLREHARARAQRILQREGTVRSRILLLLQEFLPGDSISGDAFLSELDSSLIDDEIKLLLLSCHPLIPSTSRAPLVLNVLCGWHPHEIASLWGRAEDEIGEGLAYAKRKIRVRRLSLGFPGSAEREARVALSVATLFEIFALPDLESSGAFPDRLAAAREAVRLAMRWAAHPAGQAPPLHALLAYMFLRSDCDLDRLPEAARRDGERLHRGLDHLDRAAQGGPLSPFHLYAGKAACELYPTLSRGIAERRILAYFDALLKIEDTPATALHRSDAFFRMLGPEGGRRALSRRKAPVSLPQESLLPATYGQMYVRQGHPRRAADCFREALRQADTVAARRFLMRKLNALDGYAPEPWG
jgi:RNA polymerase sigma-70 factor (ECF subfamily)